MKKAKIITSKGSLTIELYEKETPKTVENFVKLAKEGFYDGLHFHRVLPNFVIQGGCPHSKDMSNPRIGTGGPGYSIDCETQAEKQYHDRGVLSMAHAGKNTGGSQFFICHSREGTQHLDGGHTCFAKVIDGDELIDQIAQGDEIQTIKMEEE